jgi:iron(III) transport system permease protein
MLTIPDYRLRLPGPTAVPERIPLSSTVVLYSGPWATMTVVMFQALEGTGAGVASAAATVLIVCIVLPVALVYRLLRRHELGMM